MLKRIEERERKDRMNRTWRRKVAINECDQCGKTFERKWCNAFKRDALTFCSSKCFSKSASLGGKFLEKKKKACLEKYGFEYASSAKEVKEKRKKTCLEKYGVEHAAKSDEVKERYKQRCLERWGVEHHLMLDSVKEKRKKTCLEKWGAENVFASEEIKKQLVETWQEKWGVDNPFAAEEVKEKIKETVLERYNVEYISQDPGIHRRAVESAVGMDYDVYYDEYLPAILSYRRKVWAVTRKQPLHELENFEQRGREEYHVDHVLSIREGFDRGIDPEIVGHISNLRMLPAESNRSKGARSDIELEELLAAIEEIEQEKV